MSKDRLAEIEARLKEIKAQITLLITNYSDEADTARDDLVEEHGKLVRERNAILQQRNEPPVIEG